MTEIWVPILSALITGALSLMGVYIANRKSAALIEYRIKQLEDKQDAHNKLIERTYKLEDHANVVDVKLGVMRGQIDELERKVS
jgi:hypothetical protein